MSRNLSLLSLAIFLLPVACAPSAEVDASLSDASSLEDAGESANGRIHDAGTVDASPGDEDAGTDAGAGDDDAGSGPNDAGPGPNDAGPGDDDAGPGDDDAGPGDDDAGANDGGPGPGDDDAGPGDDDAGPGDDDAGANDGGPGSSEIEAVLGERCEPSTRVGLVEIVSWGGDTFYASAQVFDAPPPWFGPPSLSDESCALYEGVSTCICSTGGACAFGGGCAPRPAFLPGLTLRLRAGDEEQVFDTASYDGMVEGAVTLEADAFAVELLVEDLHVRTPVISLPPSLQDAEGELHGTYDAPTGLDLSWTPTSPDVDVFTHIPINHHVAQPTFTECRVAGSVGALSVPGPMLAPLAVSTGLEFQALEPARFAAATTERGCVEVRFTRKQFVSGF